MKILTPLPTKLDPANHPCFNPKVHRKAARIHLPVAPRCNLQCNYCNRSCDCPNESRPGVTSAVLKPTEALLYLKAAHLKLPQLTVTGIAGPGDPFANPDETMETLRLVRRHFPNMLLCVATNGLGLLPHIDELADLKVSHITLTINTREIDTAAKIYAWVRDGYRVRRGREGAALLLDRQREAIERLRETSILVKANTIVMPGVNDHEVEGLATWFKQAGVGVMNCMSLLPVPDTPFEALGETPPAMLAEARNQARGYLPQMLHCARCRADACGLVGKDAADVPDPRDFTAKARREARTLPHVAVASREGVLVNQHLGEAERILVYREGEDGPELVEERPMPTQGLGIKRWLDLCDRLDDCRAVLVSGVGKTPRGVLEEHGLTVLEMEGLIDEGLDAVFAGRDLPASLRRRFTGCGTACVGTGGGCG